MKIIGLTGGMASGKSTVSEMLRDEGLVVVDADVLAREVVKRGSFGLWSLAQAFGPGILKADELDRGALRGVIFDDEKSRLVVERITHPLIQWRARQEFKRLESKGEKVVVYDAALIFEKNLTDQFASVVVVQATPDIQIERLIARDKVPKEAAWASLKSQWPLEKKAAAAQFVIDNSGSKEQTRRQVRELVKQIRERG